MMFNQMKDELCIPDCLRTAHVTILHKKKCKLDLNNWIGIFVCSVLRTILMKLVYGRTYVKVDQSMTDSQIGARKKKSVRNHLFVVNSIISDVMSSVHKDPIDLSIMDFKQMFDSEELTTCLNAIFDAGIQDDMLALIYEANKITHFAVKTPNGITETRQIENKILQGDVLAPLLSSNMVDKHIGLPAVNSGNVYLYKGQVVIPPLTMQDDTLGISKCGYLSKKMNNFINTRTNIMGLQFGSDKCQKMHIRNKHKNLDICVDLEVDVWKDEIVTDNQGNNSLVDKHIGKEVMQEVSEKKYLGHILQSDGKNDKNIKDKTDKAVGSVNKIMSALSERPYGKHSYRAALLMRQGLMLGGMLTNAETWINVTEADLTKLTMPDTMLQRQLLSVSGNPSKMFMCLELGVIPVKYVIIEKRLNMLHHILNESTSSTMRQVYEVLKCDSRKGDFYSLVKQDMLKLEINLEDKDIRNYSEAQWKLFVKHAIKTSVFQYLSSENSKLENTKQIKFEALKTSEYLLDNRNTSLSKIIFSLRSKTYDIKTWQPWKYFDNLCVICELKAETMEHFLTCESYGNIAQERNWKTIFESDIEIQFDIAKVVKRRQKARKQFIDKYEAGHPQIPSGSRAPGNC